ncbi:ferredoxin domain-containing protein [Pelotomaculum propionicicum]|uniref:DUF2148 domain-containing protein n=1 Tax=Pelotomaculum propionicicum TaxID=258475 RepID=A0A4Y7RPC5_9FIRM|nr:DUF2148 domain-containing protein [Pelotomaculum propionicicum]NLI12782.1 hypothetical protein [Peptococcaceae bacterium]TEB10589.1 hypothetical protein Pmgp_02279 [Pelotomaculum propionicicum]
MKDTMLAVAGLMELAARTAPKAGGRDFVGSKVVSGEDLKTLADAMERYGQEKGVVNFDRDAANVRRSDAVLLLSLDQPNTLGLNCGACGYSRCADLKPEEGPEFVGPLCAWRVLDLGIALGSAAKTAGILNADNRIMYRVGVAARKIGMIKGELVVGIPISATGKSIYFDR